MTEWAWAIGGMVVALTLTWTLDRFALTPAGKKLERHLSQLRQRRFERQEASFKARAGWWFDV